jgi:hypothetical protein
LQILAISLDVAAVCASFQRRLARCSDAPGLFTASEQTIVDASQRDLDRCAAYFTELSPAAAPYRLWARVRRALGITFRNAPGAGP